MTTFAVPLHERLPAMLRKAASDLRQHTQQIVSLQTTASALTPGSWANITPMGGWANAAGAIPAQARLITTSTVQVIGNLTGGDPSDGTVIGTLPVGFFNVAHQHTFPGVAVTGAANVAVAGTVPTSGNAQQIPASDHTFSSFPFTLGPSGTQFANFTTGLTTSTPVNYNMPSITLDTQGNLTIANFSASTTQISFHESHLPLFTD